MDMLNLPLSALLVQHILLVNLVLVRVWVERSCVDRQEIRQLYEMNVFSQVCNDPRNFHVNASFWNRFRLWFGLLFTALITPFASRTTAPVRIAPTSMVAVRIVFSVATFSTRVLTIASTTVYLILVRAYIVRISKQSASIRSIRCVALLNVLLTVSVDQC